MASKTKGKQPSDTGSGMDYGKMEEPLDEQELEALYAWVDSIPLSRPKRNISRDFSDGVLVAEIMHHFFPKLVEMHNYSPANATPKKLLNWSTLNRRVFSKMNFELAEDVINDLVACKPGMIEKVLLMLQVKIESAKYAQGRHNDKPEADQHQASPGRKDGKMIRVGMEENMKGKKIVKAKQEDIKSPAKAPAKPGVIPKKRIGQISEPDMVPRYVVEEKEQEVLTRDETIQILNSKIMKLEHLLHLKDRRISELADKVTGYEYSPGNKTNYDYRVYNKR